MGGTVKIYVNNPKSQNSIHEEIKSRLKSGNACYHSVQNLLSSSLLFKNIKNCNFACCFVWVCNLVSHTEEGTQDEGEQKYGTV